MSGLENAEISAVAREVLEYLADRTKRAAAAASVASWTNHTVPKVQAALDELRKRGFVRYFPGHPGSWAVTADGYREVDVGAQSLDRYRMALESILSVGGTFDSDNIQSVRKIATRALDRA